LGFVLWRFALENNRINSDLKKPLTKGDFLLAQVEKEVSICTGLAFIFLCLAIGAAISAVHGFFTDADLSSLVSKAVASILGFVMFKGCLNRFSRARKEEKRIRDEMAGLD
jgi:hypothetical protein